MQNLIRDHCRILEIYWKIAQWFEEQSEKDFIKYQTFAKILGNLLKAKWSKSWEGKKVLSHTYISKKTLSSEMFRSYPSWFLSKTLNTFWIFCWSLDLDGILADMCNLIIWLILSILHPWGDIHIDSVSSWFEIFEFDLFAIIRTNSSNSMAPLLSASTCA